MSGETKKLKAEQAAVGVLFVIFSVVLVRSLRASGVLGGRVPVAAPARVQQTPKAPPLQEVVRERALRVESSAAQAAPAQGAAPSKKAGYTAQRLRDPMKQWLPAVVPKTNPTAAPSANAAAPAAEVKPPALALSGLWWGAAPKAIINDRMHGVGDHVHGADGAVVKAIERDGVLIEFAGRTLRLTLAEQAASTMGSGQRMGQRR